MKLAAAMRDEVGARDTCPVCGEGVGPRTVVLAVEGPMDSANRQFCTAYWWQQSPPADKWDTRPCKHHRAQCGFFVVEDQARAWRATGRLVVICEVSR